MYSCLDGVTMPKLLYTLYCVPLLKLYCMVSYLLCFITRFTLNYIVLHDIPHAVPYCVPLPPSTLLFFEMHVV